MGKMNEIIWKVETITRNEMFGERASNLAISAAYQFLCKRNLIHKQNNELLKVAEEMNERVSKETIDKMYELFEAIGKEGIKEYIYEVLSGKSNTDKSFIENASDNLCELTYNLLEIDGSGHSVLDLGSGTGNFLANVYKKSQEENFILKDLVGIELNLEQAQISNMALNILSDGSVSPIIFAGNALEIVNYPYTRAYVFPPLGMKKLIGETGQESNIFKDLYFSNKNTGEWLFIDSMLGGLLGDRAVAIVTGKALFNDADLEYRKRLLKSGRIEGIIELPSGSLSFTGIKVFMIVFGKDNKEVRFIDASNVATADNKRYANFELPVRTVTEMYYSKDVKTKPITELINATNLMPSTVLLDVKKLDNGVQLKNVSEIFIGNQYTLGVFERKGMLTDKKTGYKILTSSDIEDGIVDWEGLKSIDYKDDKFDKFAVKYGDVVVTSKSSKVKTVVVDIEPVEKILVTGGMIIVRPNLKKLNSTYLKMFLDSKDGQNALRRVQKGSYIVTINASSLGTVEVPLINIEEQEIKADRYNSKLSTLVAYKNEIKRIENSLENLFLDEEGD